MEYLYEIELPLALKEMTAIYVLVDPRTNAPKYVGKSNNPPARFAQHFERKFVDHERLIPKEVWIKELFSEGLFPKMVIVKEVPEEEGEVWEQKFISEYKSMGHVLFNSANPTTPSKPKKKAYKRIPGLPGSMYE
ncbi:GIY-YIG nuclease family protein [Thiomicrorhabdus sp.]|uniref:GIY-YIG nuclease family protein n=1 Tax=Thiomicrorhabdus sp. TaxID=2039724 RepID=UPI0029C81FF3|nr:GIY-YIG nuclease family protein [Thiomicrorhabdus sp.]